MEYKIETGSSNYILASLLTGVYDINRNELLKQNEFSLVQKWYDSIMKLKMNAILFHNSFSTELTKKYTNEYVQFMQVEYNEKFNPNIYRYFVYQDFLNRNSKLISNLFLTDITDVEILINPFETDYYKKNTTALFCGNEPKFLNNEWMYEHCTHLRKIIPGFSLYEEVNKNTTLLNCGIIGGNTFIVKLLLKEMVDLHKVYSLSNNTAYTLDMGVFNYVARTKFEHNIIHGAPVNTVFKGYETQTTDCWFRHK